MECIIIAAANRSGIMDSSEVSNDIRANTLWDSQRDRRNRFHS